MNVFFKIYFLLKKLHTLKCALVMALTMPFDTDFENDIYFNNDYKINNY